MIGLAWLTVYLCLSPWLPISCPPVRGQEDQQVGNPALSLTSYSWFGIQSFDTPSPLSESEASVRQGFGLVHWPQTTWAVLQFNVKSGQEDFQNYIVQKVKFAANTSNWGQCPIILKTQSLLIPNLRMCNSAKYLLLCSVYLKALFELMWIPWIQSNKRTLVWVALQSPLYVGIPVS